MDVDFSLNEDVILSGSAHDRTIRLWDTQSGEELKKIIPGGEVQSVEMASDGKFFISAGEGGDISIWGVISNS
jgi:WD40 repeat protein